jgi:hypothetical protein
VGHHTYSHFLLFVFYLWLGCAYACAATCAYFRNQLADERLHRRPEVLVLLVEVVLTSSVCAALSLLWLLHVFLVCSGHSTISLLKGLSGRQAAGGGHDDDDGGGGGGGGKEARDGLRARWRRLRAALRWQGAAARWRRTFGASGRLWWLTWAVPPLRGAHPEDGMAAWQHDSLGGRAPPAYVHAV